MTTRTRRIAVTLAVPTLLLFGACGTSTAPASTTTGTVTSASSIPNGDSAAGAPHRDRASFVAAMKAGMASISSAHVSMKLEGQGQQISIEGVTKVDAADPAMQLTMSMGGADVNLIVLDGKVYVKGIPGAAAEGKWAQFDKDSAIAKSMLESASGADPTKMFEDFDKAVAGVSYVGADSVGGEQLQKYSVKLDTAKMDTGGDTASLPKTVDYDVWMDAKDRMRKVTFDLSGVKADMVMDQYDEPLHITAPPAGQVVKGQG